MTSRILIGCMLSEARSDCVAGRKYERVSRGVFHLPRNSGNSGWVVNVTRFWFVPLENFRNKWNF